LYWELSQFGIGCTFSGQVHIRNNVTVIEYKGTTQNYQGLLGRDVICQGYFQIGFDNRFVFSL